MPKAPRRKTKKKSLRTIRFSETWLLIFAMAFAAIGSYTYLRGFAAPEDAGFLVQTAVSSEERAWFSSIGSAALIILAAGPVAVFLLWWIWRRWEMFFLVKLLLTVAPVLIIMAFT